MTAAQRKAIFGICKKLGMSDDDRHALVLSVTGKESTKELTDRETEEVLKELWKRLGGETVPPEKRNPKAYRPEVPGMITNRQKGRAFALLYELKKYDETPSKISDGARMAGIIRKELKITAYEGEHLWDWVNFENAVKLIEALKGYVNSAKKKAKGRENNENRR